MITPWNVGRKVGGRVEEGSVQDRSRRCLGSKSEEGERRVPEETVVLHSTTPVSKTVTLYKPLDRHPLPIVGGPTGH